MIPCAFIGAGRNGRERTILGLDTKKVVNRVFSRTSMKMLKAMVNGFEAYNNHSSCISQPIYAFFDIFGLNMDIRCPIVCHCRLGYRQP